MQVASASSPAGNSATEINTHGATTFKYHLGLAAEGLLIDWLNFSPV
jgi:hypothetical protein